MIMPTLTRTLSAKPALAALVLAPALTLGSPAPAFAQDDISEARMRKIEAEIRALQRNVFPGGDERFFEPQIRPGESAASTSTAGPSTTAVTDILARLDAMEGQLQRLTAVSEENANAIGLLSTRLDQMETSSAVATPNATEETGALSSNLSAMGADNAEAPDQTGLPAGAPSAQSPPEVITGPTAERLAAVQAITKPQTDDPADDEYSYGFRLWNAGFYPESRQQLSSFLESYPDHWRATYGRNLLGRAYLDDGMTEEAARWFLKNYQEDRTGARAADSLLFLAEAMIAREDTRRACIALSEFAETYPAVAAGRLLSRYQSNRGKVTCEG